MAEEGAAPARRAAVWAGWQLEADQMARLAAFADWLEAEAIPAGGLGPNEGPRIWSRHLGDSLTMARAWPSSPTELLDVGTGVGLPGIPLAILWPQTRVVLLDRAGRRIRLLRRAVRLLALENVRVEQGDIFAVADQWRALVFRGAVAPVEAVGLCSRLLDERGRAAFALSRRDRPERVEDLHALAAMFDLTTETVQVPEGVLDGPSWILIINRRGN